MADKFMTRVGVVVYGSSAILTFILMIKRGASFHTTRDFLGWFLVFLAITFVCWLITFLVEFIIVKYKDRT